MCYISSDQSIRRRRMRSSNAAVGVPRTLFQPARAGAVVCRQCGEKLEAKGSEARRLERYLAHYRTRDGRAWSGGLGISLPVPGSPAVQAPETVGAAHVCLVCRDSVIVDLASRLLQLIVRHPKEALMPVVFFTRDRGPAVETVYFTASAEAADELVFVTKTRELADKTVYEVFSPEAADKTVYRVSSRESGVGIVESNWKLVQRALRLQRSG